MEKKNYFEWVFTRWYYWAIVALFFAVSIDSFSIGRGEMGYNIGLIIGSFLWALIIPSITYLFYRRKLKKKEIKTT